MKEVFPVKENLPERRGEFHEFSISWKISLKKVELFYVTSLKQLFSDTVLIEDFSTLGKLGKPNILILSLISILFELYIVASFVVINRFNLYFELGGAGQMTEIRKNSRNFSTGKSENLVDVQWELSFKSLFVRIRLIRH